MQFYKITAEYRIENIEDYEDTPNRPARKESRVYSRFINSCINMMEKKESAEKKFVFLADVKPSRLTFGAICRNRTDIKNDVIEYAAGASVEINGFSVSEVTYDSLYEMLRMAVRHDVFDDEDDVLDVMEMDCFSSRRERYYYCFSEFVPDDVRCRDELREYAAKAMSKESLLPELERIFAGAYGGRAYSHPVHYIIRESDEKSSKGIRLSLQEALYLEGRLRNKRYIIIERFNDASYGAKAMLDNMYESVKGGVVVCCLDDYDDDENDRRTAGNAVVVFCDVAVKYRQEVLTIFCLPTECEKLKNRLLENLLEMSFVELCTDVVFDGDARAYLKEKARKADVRADKNLYSSIRVGEGMHIRELNESFEKWLDVKVKTTVYPQYRFTLSAKETVRNKKPVGSAMDELEKMIGLSEAKSVIKKALDYYKIQKMYRDMCVSTERPAMHMVFTGNPGTAKTTVARLFARIMKDNGLLSQGNLFETGRADLVGKYVGHTAPLIKEKFKSAKGSVLFIDEAYSLLDDRAGMYGDEAINTIVQEMENNRDNMVVIFAGYPDKMEDFMNRNPGLRSRISFHIHFDDYNTDELCSIAKLIADEGGNIITEEAMERLRTAFDAVRWQKDFGNGRYVRNIIEQARLEQAGRLVGIESGKVTREMLRTIEAEDILIPDTGKNQRRVIGFSGDTHSGF